MNSFKRITGGSVAAMGVTFGLGALMAAMIAVEFVPKEKPKTGTFEINPIVEDIEPLKRRIQPKALKRVETPPSPPMIDRQAAALPTEQFVTLDGAVMTFDPPAIDAKITNISITDRDEQPLVRIPPVMPLRAQKSGQCKIRFDVNAAGSPYNITALYCSSVVFKSASIKSVQKWSYRPKIQNGQRVNRTGLETDIVFRLTDDRGRQIPE